ncbi:hypothetical protein [Bacillus infantis]|uniref:hypothetical protein n=1 Tax=Bacillus infantis TaxID=324767 RepID=UPI003CEF79F0
MLRSGYIFYDQWSFLKKQEFDFTGAGIPQQPAWLPSGKRASVSSELLILPGKREFLCAVKKIEGLSERQDIRIPLSVYQHQM